MNDIKKDIPAFPIELNRYISHGMSLRDYFAAKALQGLLATGDYEVYKTASTLSKNSYVLADAMLEARGEK